MMPTGLKPLETAFGEAAMGSASSRHQDKNKCPPHHYVLGDPVNGIVSGYCKYCGVNKRWNCKAVETQVLRFKKDWWPAKPGT
jgi:hypothetical protein